MNILALDVGTTSIRGVLFDASGTRLAHHAVQTPLEFVGEYIEQKPSRLLEAVQTICKQIAADHAVDALSLTAYRSAVAMCRQDGTPLCNFIMWQDQRNQAICQQFTAHNSDILSRSGAEVNAVFTATKLTWMRQNWPDIHKVAYKYITVADYLIHAMTGVFATDRTYGSRTHLMNIHTLQWDPYLTGLFGVDAQKLCPLVDQGSVVGHITDHFSSQCGLPSGIPLVSAGGDQQCSALGLGVLDSSSMEVNNGTGSFIITLTPKPVSCGGKAICNVSAIPGLYTLETNVLSSASAFNWLLNNAFQDLVRGPSPDYEAINQEIRQVPPGSHGVLCLPYFQGCGARDWNPEARALFYGMTLQTTPAILARSLLEGIAIEIRRSMHIISTASHASADNIRVSGGLSSSKVFNQIQADVYGAQVVHFQDVQATAIGAFISAAKTLGVYSSYEAAFTAVRSRDQHSIYSPDSDRTAIYRKIEQQGDQLYSATKKLYLR